MATKRRRLVVERLEQRQLLSGTPWFENSGQHLGAQVDGAELADLDGDGDVDLFAGCRNHPDGPPCSKMQVWLNNGSGQFSAGWSGGTPPVADVKLGDLDNDGDLDAFVTKSSPHGSGPNEVWQKDGQGNFENSRQRLSDTARDVELGDVDGDGDLDAVTASLGVPSKVWLNDGTGIFTDSRQRIPEWMYRVALGDLDGDGDLDAWFGRGTDSPDHVDRVYLNDGTGNFTDSGQRLNTVSTGDVQLGDLDGDGDLDAYLANGNGRGGNIPDRVWFNDGTGKFTDSGQRLGRSVSLSVELGDVDDDGDLDAVVTGGSLLFGNEVKQPNDVWLNDGKGFFTHSGQEIGNESTVKVQLGDLDNDGDLDAFFGNMGQDSEVWFNVQLIAGDANRDGVFNQLDIVQILQSAKYQTGQPATWAEGDFNRDGVFDQLDIVAALQSGRYGQA